MKVAVMYRLSPGGSAECVSFVPARQYGTVGHVYQRTRVLHDKVPVCSGVVDRRQRVMVVRSALVDTTIM